MTLHYLKTATRSIARHKLYSVISILGLAVGMAVCMLVMAFVNHERSFNNMYPDGEQIHRLIRENSDTGARLATFFTAITPSIARNFPEVEAYTRLFNRDSLLTVANNSYYQSLSMVDSNYFDFFPSGIVAGDPATTLADPSGAVVTEAAADFLFGSSSEVIGRVFTVNNEFEFRVGAIIENNPVNSHLTNNFLINIENAPEITGSARVLEHPRIGNTYNYLKLARNIDVADLETRTYDYIRETIEPQFNYRTLYQPLADIHFTANLESEEASSDPVTGITKLYRDKSDLYIFSAVALLTLIVSAFNFVNLQIVQATKRIRDTGVRRTLGASRKEIAFQHLAESMLMSLAALFIAHSLCQIFAPYFSSIVATSIQLYSVNSIANTAFVIASALVVGLVAGLFPAVMIAGLPATRALRGEIVGSLGHFKFRSFLVVLQFSVCIGLIISSGIVSKQINYALSKPLGYEPENVVVIDNLRISGASSNRQFQLLRDELMANNSIVDVSSATAIPTGPLGGVLGYSREGESGLEPYSMRGLQMSHEFFSTVGMTMLAGRALSDEYSGDRSERSEVDGETRINSNVVINQAAARAMGWINPQDALNNRIYRGSQYFTVVGVVEDAHFSSLRNAIEPMFFRLDNTRNYMLVKFREGNTAAALQAIDRVWQRQIPNYPIQRNFLSDLYAAAYATESRTLSLFTSLTLVAVLISCLGLYALAAYMAELRTKEIGIRKIVGASVARITGLLSWDFCRLVLVANVIAWPVVWWLMQRWLSNFAYQTEVSILIFMAAAISTFLLALATTAQRSYKAASANPAESLRFE